MANRRIPFALLVLCGAGCHSAAPERSANYDMEVCVPPDTVVLAGFHLDRLRGTDSYGHLPPDWKAALEPLLSATYLMLAYNGRDLLVIARGHFSPAPPGAVLLTPELALAGSPEAVRAAGGQRATGKPGAASLLARAAAIEIRDIWAVAGGGASLPFTGNIANLNRLLRFSDYATVAATVSSSMQLDAAAFCATVEAARQLEETLRGLISLAAGAMRDRDLAMLIQSAQLRRDDSTVHVALTATLPALDKLLR